MDKCIVIGVDAGFSPQSQHALRTASDLFGQSALGLHFILLTVIELPCDPSPALMKARGIGQICPLSPTHQQRRQATEVLSSAEALLGRRSFALARQRVELVQRFGDPAREVVRVAAERCADCIVLGSRGNSPRHHLRRVFGASTSCDIVRLSPCPVILVIPPRIPRPANLVSWERVEARRVRG